MVVSDDGYLVARRQRTQLADDREILTFRRGAGRQILAAPEAIATRWRIDCIWHSMRENRFEAITRTDQRTNALEAFPRAARRRETSARDSGAYVPGEFATVLDRSGLHAGLGYLNGRVRFRFTGVYRFEPSALVNACLYDRENPWLDQCGTVLRLPDTYCVIARALGDVFATENAPEDPRLEGHSARNTVISYTGIPIRLPSGRVAGVLCHYDLRPRLLPKPELGILRSAADYLARWLDPSLAVAARPRQSR